MPHSVRPGACRGWPLWPRADKTIDRAARRWYNKGSTRCERKGEQSRMKTPIMRKKNMALALLLACALAGCGAAPQGEAGQTPAATPQRPAQVQAALDDLRAAQRWESEQTRTVQVQMLGQAFDVQTQMQSACVAEPFVCRYSAQTQGLSTEQAEQAYVQAVEDGYRVYTENELRWTAYDIGQQELEETWGLFDAQRQVSAWLEAVGQWQQQGEETVQGVQALRFEGVLPASSLSYALMDAWLGEAGIDPERAQAAFDTLRAGVGDQAVTLWIDAQQGQVLQVQMDLTATVQGMVQNAIRHPDLLQDASLAQNLEVQAMRWTVTLRQLNTLPDIQVPQQALDAAQAGM